MTDYPSHSGHDAVTQSQIASACAATTEPLSTRDSAPQETYGEEDFTIKCVCVYPEDDGHTVECEACLSWQHIRCYYPDQDVPDVHKCVECEPRSVDVQRAQERFAGPSPARKVRRTTAKTGKKKTKDAVSGQVNGWPLQEHPVHINGTGRKSGSPRELPPPAKKAKLSHKASGSKGSFSIPAPTSRRRGDPNVDYESSPVTTDLDPNENCAVGYYSIQFMNLHRLNSNFTQAQTNLHLDIRTTNDLFTWLSDPGALAQVTGGKQPQDVYTTSGKHIEAMRMPELTKKTHEDTSQVYHNQHPIWQYLVTKTEVSEGSVVGEVKGQVGRLEDYKMDPSNRWQQLEHPDHFVFFHPMLPIYIDARSEGTILRYARRSCTPNMNMKTIITDEREHRFCLVATEHIDANEEVTIGWDYSALGSEFSQMLTGNDGEMTSQWVGKLLANFGGCACTKGSSCIMAYYDRRQGRETAWPIGSDDNLSNGRKQQKSRWHASPTNMRPSNNSRAGSEVLHNGKADENEDSRSSSGGSARSKPQSRDLTPMTATSGDGHVLATTGLEYSDREKRKLMQQERLFDKLEQDELNGSKRRKRTSVPSSASALHVVAALPEGVSSSSSRYSANNELQRQSTKLNASEQNSAAVLNSKALRSSTTSNSRTIGSSSISGSASLTSPPMPLSSSDRKSRPVEYKDATVQTDPDSDDVQGEMPSEVCTYQTYTSLKRRLLRRCYEHRVRAQRRTAAQHEHSPKPSPNDMPPPPAPQRTLPSPCGRLTLQKNRLLATHKEMKTLGFGTPTLQWLSHRIGGLLLLEIMIRQVPAC